MPVISGGVVIPGGQRRVQSYAVGSPAAASSAAIHAAAATAVTPQVVTTGITQPDVPRNVNATTAGTNTDVAAVSVIVTGTDINGETISETLPAFTVDTNGTVTGSKAFKTITGYTVPAMDGTGATVAIGTGSKLGLPDKLSRNGVIAAFLNGVREATAPTVAFDSSNAYGNLVTLSSSLNGTPVIVDYYAN